MDESQSSGFMRGQDINLAHLQQKADFYQRAAEIAIKAREADVISKAEAQVRVMNALHFFMNAHDETI